MRGPASDCACAGIRPTIGLASRAGIIPARLNRDEPGVLARTVSDMVRRGQPYSLRPQLFCVLPPLALVASCALSQGRLTVLAVCKCGHRPTWYAMPPGQGP